MPAKRTKNRTDGQDHPFIRARIPRFKVPAYPGKRYRVMVPDTLDIQQRIALAVNGLTGPTDPDKHHLLYFRVTFRANPPSMTHGPSDICQVKFMESLPLMRLASGSTLNNHVDRIWMKSALRMLGPDGLAYWPSYPWAKYPDWCQPCSPNKKHYAAPIFCGRLMGAMTLYMLHDTSGPWNDQLQKMVDGLWSVAIERDDYAYFPKGGFAARQRRPRQAPLPLAIWSSLVGWTIQGLSQYHRASGYQPAVDLAGKLSRYVVQHGKYYGPDGEFLPNYIDPEIDEKTWQYDGSGMPIAGSPHNHTHFQHHMIPLLGMLDHALAIDDHELADFVRRSFEWARTKGNIMVGYFPENIDNQHQLETSELCEVAGMIGLALKLSAAGLGDYWDDADRWIRNQFAEGQLLHSEWIYHMARGGEVTNKTKIPPSAIDPRVETCDHVPERNLGAFAGWPSANDWYVGHDSGIMHCCTGNATRALYYIWEHMLTYDRGSLSVNLLMNRPSKWADVHSHLPYAGRVDVSVKRKCRQLRLRIPPWVKRSQARCTVNKKKHKIDWEGRYAQLGQVSSKDQVTLSFPITERQLETDIQSQHYHMIARGNDIVDIYPRGKFCPLYQRAHCRTDQTRWTEVDRFISDESIFW